MTPNATLIQKADLLVADLQSDGGYLQPAQSKTFIQTIIDESTIMPQAVVLPMKAPLQLLEKARFASRVLRAGTEGQALGVADRAKPDLEKVQLSAQLFKAEVRLTNEVLEDSIEGGTFRQTVMEMLGTRIALDMDEIGVKGDTTSTDAFLAKFDGILKQATVNQVDAARTPISKTILRDMIKAMPTEFLRNQRLMRYFAPIDTEVEYRDTVAARETVGGDASLSTYAPMAYSGIPILGSPVFPENLGDGFDEQSILLTDPKNIVFGIWRQIQIENDKDITAGTMIVVCTIRFDVKFIESRATVKANRLIHNT